MKNTKRERRGGKKEKHYHSGRNEPGRQPTITRVFEAFRRRDFGGEAFRKKKMMSNTV